MTSSKRGNSFANGATAIGINNDVIIAPGVKIISANHSKTDLHRWDPAPPIRIGRRCWIGANAVILPGVELGDDCIVGAGAVVTNSFPSGSTVVGVPGRAL